MLIYKSTMFGFTRQPPPGFRFQQCKICEFGFLYCWNL